MKQGTIILSIVFLFSITGNMELSAQEANPGQLWFVWEATVHPDMQNQFIESQKDFHGKFKEHGFPYYMYTWTDSKFGWYFFYPVKNYNEKNDIYSALQEVAATIGEDNIKKMWQTVQSHRTYFMQYLPDISYMPEQPRLDMMDMTYAFWDVLYVKPEKEAEFLELMKKLAILHTNYNFDDPIRIYMGDIGYEGSVYIGALSGQNRIDFLTQNQKMWEGIGEEGVEIFQKMLTLLRKRDFKEFWYSSDLSYIPE